jgi:asparagine synthase (glutamine-hydrolysing)
MTDTLEHRGPDGGGAWLDPDNAIALGHRRLAILDLSPAGDQPMVSHSGCCVLSFNGEIYNHGEIRHALEAAGHRIAWRGSSDTEVMLEALERFGVERALAQFNGMFAFALWNRKSRTLTLARDRMGEKPLYHGWAGSSFLFGSELKALRAHPAWRGEINPGALALYIRHACVPAPHSIYRDIGKLMPGHWLTLDISSAAPGCEPSIKPYWSAKAEAERAAGEPFDGDEESALEALDERLRRSIALRRVADVPLGAFLSGGIDSSTITALMQADSSRPIKTFTIGFTESGFDEAPHARAVARHLATDHTELYVSDRQAREIIPRLPAIYDEPFGDVSGIPTILLAELTRRHVTVSLSGDGGDELFGGYGRHDILTRQWRRLRRVPRALRAVSAGVADILPGAGIDACLGPLGIIASKHHRPSRPGSRLHKKLSAWGAASPERLFQNHVGMWHAPPLAGAAARAARAARTGGPPTAFNDPARIANLACPAARFMYLDATTYLPDDILTKVDRATMAFGLEGRMPLLDHNLVQFVWRLPLAHRRQKYLLRQLLYRYVPPRLVDRPKAGFEPPVANWLRTVLRDWAEDLLSEDSLRASGLLNAKPIRAGWKEHLGGRRNRHLPLWSILMFQAWLRSQ